VPTMAKHSSRDREVEEAEEEEDEEAEIHSPNGLEKLLKMESAQRDHRVTLLWGRAMGRPVVTADAAGKVLVAPERCSVRRCGASHHQLTASIRVSVALVLVVLVVVADNCRYRHSSPTFSPAFP
jgi:hypothetical protein